MKGITGSLVKHNGLMLAQPSGNGLTIFDLSSLLVSSPLLLEQLVSIVKEILYYATRKGSALTVLLDEGDESSLINFKNSLKSQGLYLADFEVVYRSDIENNGYVSEATKLAKKKLKVKKFSNARLFSDRAVFNAGEHLVRCAVRRLRSVQHGISHCYALSFP